MLRLLREPANCDYLLAVNLPPAFARACLPCLDHCNSLGGEDNDTGGEDAAQLDMLLQVG